MNIKISLGTTGFKQAENALAMLGDQAKPAIARAINRELRGVATDASREARKIYKVRASDVRRAFHYQRASASRLFGRAISSGSPIPMTRFSPYPGARPKKAPPVGLSFFVTLARGRSKVPGSFWGKGTAFRRIGSRRDHLSKLYGPSVPQMVGRPDMILKFQRAADERFRRTLEHEVGRIFQGMGV